MSKRKAVRAAARAPNWVRHVAATKAKKPRLKGTFGAAGPVTIIEARHYSGSAEGPSSPGMNQKTQPREGR